MKRDSESKSSEDWWWRRLTFAEYVDAGKLRGVVRKSKDLSLYENLRWWYWMRAEVSVWRYEVARRFPSSQDLPALHRLPAVLALVVLPKLADPKGRSRSNLVIPGLPAPSPPFEACPMAFNLDEDDGALVAEFKRWLKSARRGNRSPVQPSRFRARKSPIVWRNVEILDVAQSEVLITDSDRRTIRALRTAAKPWRAAIDETVQWYTNVRSDHLDTFQQGEPLGGFLSLR